MSERRLNGHAEIGTRVRTIFEDLETTDPVPVGTEGEITGYCWGFAGITYGDRTIWLENDEYEEID